MVPPPPQDLNIICTFDSIRYASGFIKCSAACQAGACCSVPTDLPPSILTRGGGSSLDIMDNVVSERKADKSTESCASSHKDVCASYGACAALKGLEDIHGSPTDLVNAKCTPYHMRTEVEIDDCENACHPRSCCFTESEKRNCYDDNQVRYVFYTKCICNTYSFSASASILNNRFNIACCSLSKTLFYIFLSFIM